MKTKKLIPVPDLYRDGNAFAIIGKCRRAAKKAGWTPEQLTKFGEDCRSGDFDHLLQVVGASFEEQDEDEFEDEDEDD